MLSLLLLLKTLSERDCFIVDDPSLLGRSNLLRIALMGTFRMLRSECILTVDLNKAARRVALERSHGPDVSQDVQTLCHAQVYFLRTEISKDLEKSLNILSPSSQMPSCAKESPSQASNFQAK